MSKSFFSNTTETAKANVPKEEVFSGSLAKETPDVLIEVEPNPEETKVSEILTVAPSQVVGTARIPFLMTKISLVGTEFLSEKNLEPLKVCNVIVHGRRIKTSVGLEPEREGASYVFEGKEEPQLALRLTHRSSGKLAVGCLDSIGLKGHMPRTKPGIFSPDWSGHWANFESWLTTFVTLNTAVAKKEGKTPENSIWLKLWEFIPTSESDDTKPATTVAQNASISRDQISNTANLIASLKNLEEEANTAEAKPTEAKNTRSRSK